ncbi:MAG: hypothetical protein Q7S84_01515 [bacterium]|nr:hypothetical protein [bacterium]
MKNRAPCEKIQDQYFRDKCIEIVVLATTPIPPTQLAEARNTQRRSDVAAIVNAIGQRTADNRGTFETGCAAGVIPTASTKISSTNGYDIAPCVTPTYLMRMPFDPSAAGAHYTSNIDYNTGYFIQKDSVTGQVSVRAPSAELNETITVTR